MTDSMLAAMKASEAQDWSRAESLWQAALDESGGRTPPAAYRHLVRACRHRSNYRKAEKIARQGLRRYPKHAGLNVDLAEIAIAAKDWDQASQCADTIFELFEAKPERVNDRHIMVAFEALLGAREYARTFAALRTVKGRGRASRALLAIEGFAYLRASRLEEARRHWDEYWRRANSDSDFAAQRHATRPFFDPQNQANFPARTSVNDAAASERICVYTALFDGYDELRPPLTSRLVWTSFASRTNRLLPRVGRSA